MAQLFTLFIATVFLTSAGTLLSFLWRRTHVEPPSPVIWQVVFPRGSSFDQAQAEGWFRSLIPPLNRFDISLTVEICGGGGELQLRITAPPAVEPALRGQLAVWFPEARLEQVAEERSDEAVCVLPLRFTPVKTSGEEREPLSGFLGALAHSTMPCGLRLAWRPAPTGWRALLREMRSDLQKHVREPSPNSPLRHTDPCLIAHVELWGADADLKDASRLHELATHLEHSFPAGTVTAGKSRHTKLGTAVSGSESVLSAAALATLFHVPPAAAALFRCIESRQVPPPARLLAEDPTASEILLGEALTARGPVPFGLSAVERRLHTYVVGKTGTGKSTLLAHLLRQDLAAGRGVGLIDPHGDLAERVLALVPPKRYGEVLYFNPADAEYPVGFNPLAVSDPGLRTLVASAVVSVFKKLFAASWGPRLEHFLRNTLLALLACPEPSLLLLPRFLTDRAFRQDRLRYVSDPVLRTFFHVEYESYDPRWRAEAISPILNKVGQFLASPLLRNVIGQSAPGFDLRQIMDSGGIFIANLASGRIGEDNGTLLGGLLVAQFGQAAMARASTPEAERRDFHLFVDEFQHFASDAFAQILSEARKYRLSLTLAHQFLEQLPPTLTEAVLGNVGTLCAFRLGSPDAARLQRELAPSFTASDLVHLPNHQFCVRLHRQGEVLPAFSARTAPLPAGSADLSPVIEASRQRWARPRAQVELELADLWEGRLC